MAGIAVAVAAYGYWHAATHATFSVSLAYKTDAGVVSRMRNGQIEFLDEGGEILVHRHFFRQPLGQRQPRRAADPILTQPAAGPVFA